MRRLILAALAAATLSVGTVAGPVSAHGVHSSCKDFGQLLSLHAKEFRPLGRLISGVASQDAGALRDVIRAEHGLFCAP
jgi:hypothetical protein